MTLKMNHSMFPTFLSILANVLIDPLPGYVRCLLYLFAFKNDVTDAGLFNDIRVTYNYNRIIMLYLIYIAIVRISIRILITNFIILICRNVNQQIRKYILRKYNVIHVNL